MKKGVSTMFVNPVERISVQGRHEQMYINSTGDMKPMKRTMANDTYKKYHFPLDSNTGKLRTGLDETISNPYFGRNPKELAVGSNWREKIKDIVEKREITKQTYFEILDNREEGFYNSDAMSFSLRKRGPNDKQTFLQGFSIILYDRPNPFSDDTPRGRLAQQLVKIHGRIAPSKAEANPGRHHFYISEENEAAVERTRKQDIINDAITDLTIMRRNHTTYRNYQMVILLKEAKGEVAEVTIKDILNKYISEKSIHQMDNIDKFNRYHNLLNGGREGVEKYDIMYLIQQAINTNVMSIREGHYVWHSKSGIPNVYKISTNLEKVVNFFLAEYGKYDEADENADNWYKELLTEVKNKGIKVE